MRLFYTVLTLYFLRNEAESSFVDIDQMKIPGDFVIGAIFPIRSYGGKNNFKECGQLEPAFVIQAEAFRLSIEYVNKHVLKDFTFGGLVVDECDNAVIGLQSAVRLMAGQISGTGTTDGICRSFNARSNEKNFTVIYGMTGGTNSVISERVEPLLEVFCLPLISTYATSPDFDDTKTYGYFLRTVPSDIYQAKAVYDILKHMKWYSVVVVYEKTPYGDGLQKQFKNIVETKRELSDYDRIEFEICISAEVQLSNVDPDFRGMYEIIENSGTNVVIVFTDFTTAKKLFTFMKENHPGMIGKYQYVGVDGWGRTAAAAGVEEVIANAVTTEYFSYEMPLINQFLGNLTFEQVANSKNPWLKELVQSKFSCDEHLSCANYSAADLIPYHGSGAGRGRAYYIFEAVYAFAQAFEALRNLHCGADGGVCKEFMEHSNGSQLLELLKSVRVSEPSQIPRDFVFFNGSNSGPPYYSIFQFQYDPTKSVDDCWMPIGNWSIETDQENGVLQIEPICKDVPWDCVQHRNYAADKSQGCRPSCMQQRRREYTFNKCCWRCDVCTLSQYVNRSIVEDICVECDIGEVPNKPYYNACIPAIPVYPGIECYTVLFTIFLLLAALGIPAALTATGILIWYRKTPSAILASFPLSAIGTSAIAALFASSVLTALKPSDPLCLAQWSTQPLLLTLVIGAMFVHVFHMPRDYLDSALIIPKKSCASIGMRQIIQLVMLCVLEVAFIVFCAVWFRNGTRFNNSNQPGTSYVHMERQGLETITACSSIMHTLNICILFIIPFLLLCLSLIFACRRYKSRIVFERRENRRVVWCSALILILFIFVATPVFATITHPVPRAALQTAALLLCGFIVLCIFIPTIYIMVRGHGNTWLHLTRDIKEDERITIDQLTLSDQVREGYFCEVHRGTYKRNGKQIVEIAAKMAKRQQTTNSVSPAQLSDSLLQEIIILRHLRECEHIIRLYGVCNDSESPILVFEYVNGGSCRQFVPSRRAQLSTTDLLSICACIADALCFLKEKAIVHRDVKSDNCLVQERATVQHHGTGNNAHTSKYHAKLADFGVAMEANAGRVDARRRQLFPERHTAPEGFFGNFSYESDVWSFGVFLWEVFTLKLVDSATPYEEIAAEDIAGHIMQGYILAKPQLAPQDVYDNIMKPCWESETSKRIPVLRLKQLLLARSRKISGEKATINGTMTNGRKAINQKSVTPDMLGESKFWSSPSTSISSSDTLSEPVIEKPNIVRVNYKTPALTAPGALQTGNKSQSSSSPSLYPSVLVLDTDVGIGVSNGDSAAANPGGSGLLAAATRYRNFSLKQEG